MVGIGSLDSFRKEWDQNNGIFKQKPLHNWASHGEAAFRTLVNAVNMGVPTGHTVQVDPHVITTAQPGGWMLV